MKQKLLSFLLILSASVTFAQNTDCLLFNKNTVHKTYKDSMDIECCLVIINTQNYSPEWYIFRPYEIYKIENAPEQFMLVSEVAISENANYLAYISVGEGHPILEIVDFVNLKNNNFDKEIKSLLAINPYPGYISVTNKFLNGVLVVESDMSLGKLNEKGEYKFQYNDSRKFEINIKTKIITELK